MNSKPYLSVIIPVFNEVSRKKKEYFANLEKIADFLNNKKIEFEVLVVDDGSGDGSANAAKQISKLSDRLIIIERSKNFGKWFTVREGIKKANGKYRLFTDADGSTSIENLEKFWPLIEKGEDVIIGSRDLVDSKIKIHQPKWKESLGHLGSFLTRAVIGLPKIKDTQCGFKMLSEKAADHLVPKLVIDRWGGDFELLILAEKFGYKINEVPVVWIDTGKSLVTIRGYLNTLFDLFRVKWRLLKNNYN